MKTFLIVVAGMFAALVLFVVVVIVALRFFVMSKLAKFRDAIEKMGAQLAAGAIPPFAMKLKPLPEGSWTNERMVELSAGLEQRGFASAGDFLATPFPVELKLRLLAHPALGMQAAIYEHPAAGVWMDLVTRYGDGRVVCDSSCRDHLMDSMPQKSIRFHEGADVATVYEAHVSQRHNAPWREIPLKELPQLFETIYGEEMEWRGSRGGPTAEEIGRVSERDGNPATPEIVEAIRGQWQSAFHEHRTHGLREALRDGGGLDAREGERVSDRLVFVYDGQPVPTVGELVESIREHFENPPEVNECEDEDDDRYETEESRRATEVADRVAAVGARRAFAEITREWQGRKGFRLYRAVDDPIPADAYLLPEYDEDVAGHLE
jgi:hypothetical protein